MKKRTIITVVLLLLLLAAVLAYGIHWAFFCTQRIHGQELLTQSTSPSGTYTVTAYRNNGGATTPYAVLCTVKNNETGRERNLYWQNRCQSADIQWTGEDTVTINGVSLHVWHDTYDWRRP